MHSPLLKVPPGVSPRSSSPALLLAVLIAAAVPGAAGETTKSWSFTIEKADDVICSNGAGVTNFGGPLSLRSGSPGKNSECRLRIPAPGAIRTVGMTFKYAAGYGCAVGCEGAAVMSIAAVDAAGTDKGEIYTSPALNQVAGDACHFKKECYTKEIEVAATCPACMGNYVSIKFANNQKNVQILLPIEISVDASPVGWELAAGLVAALLLYVGGGLAFARVKGSNTAPGWRAHPHSRHWVELLALSRDGAFFSRRAIGMGGRSKGGIGRTPLLDSKAGGSGGAHSDSLLAGPQPPSPAKKDKKKKQKKSSEESKHSGSKSKGLRSDSDKGDGGDQAGAATPTPEPPPAREWQPTRTGHLAVGARETGVKVQL